MQLKNIVGVAQHKLNLKMKQALNTVLSMTPRLYYETIGRNHFNPNPKNGTTIDIGGVTSLWVGIFTLVRLSCNPMLNLDVANKIGVDEGSEQGQAGTIVVLIYY